MRPGIVTRLTLGMFTVAAVVVMALKAGAADSLTPPTTTSGANSARATTAAASRPAATRYVAEPPPGYHLVSAGGHEAICMAADDVWVKAALQQALPATRPSTMPSDILRRLDSRHDNLAREMTADLGLTDQKPAIDFLDDVLRPALKKQESILPRVLFLVANKSQIVDMIKSGWNEPHFHYNRLSGEPSVDRGVQSDASGQWDDIVWPFAVDDPKVTIDEKQAALSTVVQRMETVVEGTVADSAPESLYAGFQGYIFETGIKPLHLRPDEQWFNIGVTEVLSCKYVGDLWGVPRDQLIAQRSQQLDPTINPLALDRVDALHPMVIADIEPQAQRFYIDSLRRKSAAAVNQLVTTGNEDAIGQVIAKLRLSATSKPSTQLVEGAAPATAPSTQPVDGVALIAMIKSMTDVDLTAALSR